MRSALDGVLARVEPKTPLAKLQRVWPGVVGEAFAPHATPTAMSADGVVQVSCDAAVWAQEIDLLAYELIERLNTELGPGTVRDLRARATDSTGWARQRRPGRRSS
ncbi:MAG: hypothetical protein JWM31_2198 [Solirubrobacterales bacterium]|nr:hypothetical protein [Solirubrobacterales bacterium]